MNYAKIMENGTVRAPSRKRAISRSKKRNQRDLAI